MGKRQRLPFPGKKEQCTAINKYCPEGSRTEVACEPNPACGHGEYIKDCGGANPGVCALCKTAATCSPGVEYLKDACVGTEFSDLSQCTTLVCEDCEPGKCECGRDLNRVCSHSRHRLP